MADITKTQLGWIGLGNMGLPMADKLLEAGYKMTVYNRTKEKADLLVEKGAVRANSLKELAKDNRIIFSMLYDDQALEIVTLGESGIFNHLKPKDVFIDMSTVSPASSKKVAEEAKSKGIYFLRAPVTGSVPMAKSGNLGILVSGDYDIFLNISALFDILGQKSFYLGLYEEARFMKLLINTILGTTVQILAEALTFGKKAGLDWEKMLDVINNSAISSPLMKYKQEPLLNRDFSPMFTINLINKDIDLVMDVREDLQIPMPLTSTLKQMLTMAQTTGKGELDFISLVLLAEELSGINN